MSDRPQMRPGRARARRRRGGALGPALALLLALGGVAEADEPGVIPPQLVAVEPAEGATVGAPGVLAAVLDMTRGEPAAPGTLAMRLDGVDLTTSCAVVATRDLPPSRVEIRCPLGPLAPGAHAAELRFRTGGGAEILYRWRFAVGG